MIKNIIFVGDPHLDDRTPISRLDDYSKVTLDKLRKIHSIALKRNVRTIVLAGDVFDKYQVGMQYLNEVIKVFREINDSGIEVYSIIGNHDLPYNNMNYFQNTPLNLLFMSGLVKELSKLEHGEVVLYGLNFTEKGNLSNILGDIDERALQGDSRANILTMHYATDNTIPYESIERSELNYFSLVVAGHDHMFYDYNKDDRPVVLRPGSLLRRTKDAYNLTRDPIIYLLEPDTFEIEAISLEARPAEEVFKAEVLIGGDQPTYTGVSFSQGFNEAYFKKDALDLESLINDLPIDISKKTKDYMIKYFKEQ